MHNKDNSLTMRHCISQFVRAFYDKAISIIAFVEVCLGFLCFFSTCCMHVICCIEAGRLPVLLDCIIPLLATGQACTGPLGAGAGAGSRS